MLGSTFALNVNASRGSLGMMGAGGSIPDNIGSTKMQAGDVIILLVLLVIGIAAFYKDKQDE